MRRLYSRWNDKETAGISLQNVVNGLARLKGTRDIMNSISYFFNLYDEGGEGKVDREGILRMSETLLFLSRRGFEGTIPPQDDGTDTSPVDPDAVKLSTEERFLGSVSAFIRRCFEYADPAEERTSQPEKKLEDFSIGGDEEDDEGDLISVDDEGDIKNNEKTPPGSPSAAKNVSLAVSTTSSRATSHNLALDPSKPLFITLPTFRMVILADDLLSQFFESFFPQSFHLSDHPLPTSISAAASISTNLTTFTNMGLPSRSVSSVSSPQAAGLPSLGAAGGIVPPGAKGLRGVLDNIATEGMRMAAEMRKKMDEAQREFEKQNNLGPGVRKPHATDDEDDEEEDDGAWGEKNPTRKADQDLLEGAEVASIRTRGSGLNEGEEGSSINDNFGQAQKVASVDLLDTDSKQVEFES